MTNESKTSRFRLLSLVAAVLLLTGILTAGVFLSPSASKDDARATEEAVAEASMEGEYNVEPRIRGQVEKAQASEDAVSSVELPPLQGSEVAEVTYAPEVPPAIQREHASRVVVNLETREVVKELADGVTYNFWTFGGEAPGPMIRVREGDLVELHLGNHASSEVPHNIDLHAVTGTGGGAEATLVAPGKEASFEFRALKPGLYVYHCATAPVGIHIANGMYGLILVDPKEGLPEVDREYYVIQSEFYTAGKFKEKGLQAFDRTLALQEDPTYVVFNGGVDALNGTGALEAAVGEKVRLYVGNGGPNLTSSFHVIGEIFDDVYSEAGTRASQQNVQTTLIPAGGATIVDFEVDVPGTYKLVDHAIFRAVEKGALGTLNVVGPENEEVYTDQLELRDYRPDENLLGKASN